MFNGCRTLTSFTSDLPNLTNGEGMFYDCTHLNSFTSDLSSLTYGAVMFRNCYGLTVFTSSDLSNLTNGEYMFYCTDLASFTHDLPSLTNGDSMFYQCFSLATFSSDLSNLTNGGHMFYECYDLTAFTSDLSSLTMGKNMFYHCNNLTSFSSDLSSLTNGYNMFYYCSLDTTSVQNIADTIKDVNTLNNQGGISGIYKYINIGIGNTTPNDREIAAFNRIAAKGWTVLVNGSEYTPTSSAAIATLDESGEETVASIPFWAKPIQSDEEHAEYVDSEGNFCNIIGGQFIYGDDISTYGMFASEDDAAANMRLTKIVK